jgi:hypothetical protein
VRWVSVCISVGSAALCAALAAECAFASAASAAAPTPGRYCAHESVSGAMGSEEILLGDFLMTVDVQRRGARLYVGFMNRMPDSDQMLFVAPVRALSMRDGSLRFEFDDGWGNRGEGRFDSNGRMRLRVLRPNREGGTNITRNYGAFRVSRRACASMPAQG